MALVRHIKFHIEFHIKFQLQPKITSRNWFWGWLL